MDISGYTSLCSLCEIGVRLNDVVDSVIRRHILLFPEKSKVLYRLVEDLGARHVGSFSGRQISNI